MRKLFALAVLSVAAVNAQSISVGILAGAPFTDVVNATTTNNISFLPTSTNFTVGPALQINLPLSLRFEVDALYRPYSFSVNPANGGAFPQANVSAGQWRFPFLAQYRFNAPVIKPFVVLSRISSRHGIFGILGNHDSSEMAFALEEMGMTMLVNDAAQIRRGNAAVWLIGVDDPFKYKCDDLASALSSVPAEAFKILLAHSPELYGESYDRDIDLYLCGHTHAGQICLPVIGSLRHNAKCPRSYARGHWAHGDMQGYTSAGIGCSTLPVRFNCPPEVVLIELAATNSSI